MNNLFLIFILVICIIIFGENHAIRIGCLVLILLISIAKEENFIIEEKKTTPNQYMDFVKYETKDESVNDKIYHQNLNRGYIPRLSRQGAQKNRVEMYRPLYEEMDYYENVDWYDEERYF